MAIVFNHPQRVPILKYVYSHTPLLYLDNFYITLYIDVLERSAAIIHLLSANEKLYMSFSIDTP